MSEPPAAEVPPESGEPPATPAPQSHRARRRAKRIAKWVAIGLAVVLVIAGTATYVLYKHFYGQITKDPIVRAHKPPKKLVASAENFLLMGSDTRQGKGDKKFGKGLQGARSDTTILLHLSAGDRRATLVSIPRDSYVHIPSCVIGPNGERSKPTIGKFNEAFSIGADHGNQYAASCAISAVEKLTKVHIDHYAVIDFAGFERVVDALGGVNMCVSTPLTDPIEVVGGVSRGSGLNLPAGKSVHIDGKTALQLMRARYNLDGGGDIPRIHRQQQFIAAVVHKLTSTGLLVDVPKLLRVLDAATKSLETDGFGIGEMRKLAGALHDVGPKGVRLLTVPLANPLPAGVPIADVAWDPVKSKKLWDAIRHDKPYPKQGNKQSDSDAGVTSAAHAGCLS